MSYINTEDAILSLRQRTVAWFVQHRSLAPSELFYRYLIESETGQFYHDYHWIINHESLEHINIPKQLKDQIATGVSDEFPGETTSVRRVICLIVYWVIQYHNGKSNRIPDKPDALGIFTSILDQNNLEIW